MVKHMLLSFQRMAQKCRSTVVSIKIGLGQKGLLEFVYVKTLSSRVLGIWYTCWMVSRGHTLQTWNFWLEVAHLLTSLFLFAGLSVDIEQLMMSSFSVFQLIIILFAWIICFLCFLAVSSLNGFMQEGAFALAIKSRHYPGEIVVAR